MHSPVFETPAERRGRLAAERAGEFIFTSFDDYVAAMAAKVRRSGKNMAAIARASDTIKSGTTVSNLAHGWTDKNGRKHQTQQPRFSTMFGIADALGLEVTFRPRRGGR